MPKPVRITLQLPSSPDLGEMPATIDRIGEIIDPNEHMALLLGSVDNPHGNLRAGQFVTATIQIPPEKGAVEIPARALVDDGQTLIFVQPDPKVAKYMRRQVAVIRRYRDMVYVRMRARRSRSASKEPSHCSRANWSSTSGACKWKPTLAQKQAEEAGDK